MRRGGSNYVGKSKLFIEGLLTFTFMTRFLFYIPEPFDIDSVLLEERMLASGFSMCEVSWLNIVSIPRLLISICCPITPCKLFVVLPLCRFGGVYITLEAYCFDPCITVSGYF